ncbi:hypothetical protein AtNW77_Chr3g0170471 [Arabidopsis thaliana]|jgi:hypothetical protein|uniref:At3g14060 n=4 Tax=Arabidopsis TaxID=3701 RepID=Q9LVJ2_ARATH|nr:uncharacterized protein AT3G14060 [Arabidopsis thaliana]KAG7625171.1 hypothetical protein ISN45_At03g014250 [Arabidopsis thaliana x Arabidopsis arenosa]KAG7631181.1 hypothetical protein ISN44_As03g014310 [Arabidopsis suecica]AAM60974.1 unknown [Arabidopsis thaliana]ABD60696.1 At3g14060 [Arabidopsis thaliana]AEE75460.1 hypothetical protein AT3G14060 [Arabidopsis thaliana]|eukprot:NP_566472.1 hypothetical protein AT3G14060 [Arabidopsis thaliana]
MDPHLVITAASSAFRWPSSRRKIYLRRRKPQVVRLGGKNSTPRGSFSLKKVVTRMRLKWLRLYYVRLVKKIKAYYRTIVKEFEEAGAATIQQRMTVETAAFAAPGLGLSFCPMSGYVDQPRFFLV